MFKSIFLKFGLFFFVSEVFIILFLYGVNNIVLKESMTHTEENFSSNYKDIQTTFLKNSIHEAKKNLETIINTNNFTSFVNGKSNLQLQQLLYDFVSTRNDILQVRIIDTKGMELYRVQKYDEEITAMILDKSQLQDKSHRDYYKKAIQLKRDQYLVSAFDLNQEYHQLEKPYTPTLRVLTPIVEDDKKLGIIVVNLNMQRFIDIFKSVQNRDSYLVDKDGNFLLHPQIEKTWTKDRGIKYRLKDEFGKDIANNILNNETYQNNFIYSYPLETVFQNQQGIKIIYSIKTPYIDSVIQTSILNIIACVIPFNILVGLIVIFYYSKIKYQLSKEIIKNDENINLLNKYVPMSIANQKGIIIEVNEAFCALSGYTKKELIGKTHAILKSGKQDDGFYQNMWEKISNNHIWEGEFENIKKNGQRYWIEMIIYPKYNLQTKQKEYLSISHNITDKKLMDKLAHTDHLTNLANRKKIDKELEHSLYQVQRNSVEYVLLLIDIDYFKKVNDLYGHQVGDSVLVEIANILTKNTRKSDIVGRWGGEEFMIIASHTSLQSGLRLAQKINNAVAKHNFKIAGNKTVSIGLSVFSKEDTIESVIARTDSHLYQAKETGRNKVVSDSINI